MGKRKDILLAIESQLANISIAGGYNNDISPSQVSLKWRGYDDILTSEFPQLFILSGDALYSPKTNNSYTSGGSIDSLDGWDISVLGYVHVATDIDSEGLLSKKLEDLIEDVIKVMFTDKHLGKDYVLNVYLKAVQPYLDFENNIGIFRIIYGVKYDFVETAP